MKQKNYHFSHSVLVENNIEPVWNYLTNVDRWKEWDTELIESQLLGEFKLGAKGELTPKKGPKLSFEISDINKNTAYTFKTKLPVGYLIIQRTLKQTENAVLFTDDIEFTGFLKRPLGFILGRGFRALLPEVMGQFKTIAEKE